MVLEEVPLVGRFLGGAVLKWQRKALGEPHSWLGAGVRWKLLSTVSLVSVLLWVSLLLTTPGDPPVRCCKRQCLFAKSRQPPLGYIFLLFPSGSLSLWNSFKR